MRVHGGMHGLINSPDEKTKITWPLLKRVLRYATPYRARLIAMLLLILASTGLTLLNPLILRDLIDNTIPAKDTSRLVWLAIALLIIPTSTEASTSCSGS